MHKSFSFLCAHEHMAEAIKMLQSIDGVTVHPDRQEAARTHPNEQGEFVTYKGILITGTCSIMAMPVIVQTLAEKGLAGYSRETMVEFKNKS